MDSLVGKTLGHYEVRSPLGAGGMGEVYRAHDSRLGRDVAVKVLPAVNAQSESARMRFHREAQAVAALSHPNIRSLYDVGESDGRVYAVMELLDGETLRARITRGALPARKAMEIGAAIADGLAAAHVRGIVHRDIKPENIFITASGHVKVLDFGLAKIDEPIDGRPAAQTMTGVILGTVGYMSPEQVSGSPLDARSDLFSLGCVLYEMVSGRQAFARKTVVETMSAILYDEPPDLEAVASDLQHLVAHCLEKRPEARFQSAQDLAFGLRSRSGSADEGNAIRALRRQRLLWPGVGVLFLVTILALALLFFSFRRPSSNSRQVRFDISPPSNVTFSRYGGFSLSPDGNRVAFAASSDDTPDRFRLWIHSLDTGESQPVAGIDEGVSGNPPVWSPDGRFIAFVAGGRIRKIALSGGPPQTVVEASGLLTAMTWNADDIVVFGSNSVLMKVSAAGGTVTPLTALDSRRGEIAHFSALFLPDGRHFVYARSSIVEGMSGVFIGSVDAKPEQQDARQLIAVRGSVRYAPSMHDRRVGHLVFNSGGRLLAQGFNAERLELTGEPVPVVDQVEEADSPNRPGFFSISLTDALAYRRPGETATGTPVWLDASDRTTTPLLDTPLARPEQLRLSPDGQRLAVIVAGDVWVYDLGGRPPIKLTSGGSNDMPLWTPDGKRIVYSRSGPPFQLLSVPADLAAATPESVSPPGHFHPHGWSSDGRELIVVLNSYSASGWDILGIPVHEKREPRAIVRTPYNEGTAGAALSRDGQWLAYTSNATGQVEVWVQPYPGPGAPIRVSPHGGVDPQWSRDGRHLYYLENKRLMGVQIESGPGFDFKPPAFLLEVPDSGLFPNRSYDVAADGRFIMIKRATTRPSVPPISVILNWSAGLTK